MKRILAVVLTIIATLLISCHAVFAASNTYDLDELELQITIPYGYSVITRDTPASDPIFNDLGTTKSALISQFESGSIYLDAISDTYSEEVVVTMTEIQTSDLSLYSDTSLNTFASTMVDYYADYGLSVSKYDIYQNSQSKFIKLYFTDTGKTVNGLQYYTIYDGKAMNFTMRSYEGSLSSRQETTIKTIVDSIKYDNAPSVVDKGENTDSFVHTDTDSGVTFTVPANWKQEAFSKDREFLDVKFVSTKEDGCMIIYSSMDFWEQLPISDRVGYTRSDINNSAFTKSDIAEMYTADKITTVTYNGVQYFKGEINYTSDAYGVDITVTMTQLVYIDNGWVYTFQFGGTSTHKLYSDFESMLESVQYPAVSDVGGASSTNNTNSNNSNNNSEDIWLIVVIWFVIVAVIVVAVVVSRKKNKGSTNCTPIHNELISEPPSNSKPKIYCTNCGQELPLDSDFCHMCGTKIFKEENAE